MEPVVPRPPHRRPTNLLSPKMRLCVVEGP
jgi:hypothetical protein